MSNKILIKNAMIINGLDDKVIKGKSILIEDKKIKQISENIKEDGMLIIDGTDKVVMPGMIDCHIHIDLGGEIDFAQTMIEEPTLMFVLRATERMSKYLPAGFTTVRINGGMDNLATSLRDAIKIGIISGPRVVAAGEYLSITSGHGEFFNSWVHIKENMTKFVDGPEEIRKAIREQVLNKVDVIKFFSTGGACDPNSNINAQEFADDELEMIMKEARRAFKRTSTHAHGTVGIKSAVKAGVDSVEHASILDEECVHLMKEKGTFMVPTLKASYKIIENKDKLPAYVIEKTNALVENCKNSVRMAYKAGVNIAMGTDTGTPFSYHGENALEFELMVKCGMSNMDAIISGTRKAADNLGIGDITGTIEEGKFADLLLINGNPLQDIKVLQDKSKIEIVIKEGNIEVNRL
ncbi:MAG: amidohydrolase family protein [Syntrophomonas sp.]|nr:amidohydrolase family protein [Syntrophomonas sp.]